MRVARFEREAKAIAALSHPNVLAIFDTGVHDGHPLRRHGTARRRDARDAARRRRRCRSARRSSGAARSRAASRRRTARASSIATSSRTTSSSPPTATPRFSTSASPRPPIRARPARAGLAAATMTADADYRCRHGDGHRRLHVAGAGARRADRRAQRPVLLRRGALRDAHRNPRVPRRHHRRNDDRDPARGSARGLDDAHAVVTGARSDRASLPGEAAGRALSDRA